MCCGCLGWYSIIAIVCFILLAGAAAAVAIVVSGRDDSGEPEPPLQAAWGSVSCNSADTTACGDGTCMPLRPGAATACQCPAGTFGDGCSSGQILDEATVAGLTNGTHILPILTRAEVIVQPGLERQPDFSCSPDDSATQVAVQRDWLEAVTEGIDTGPSIELIAGTPTQGSLDSYVAVSVVSVPGSNATAADVARVVAAINARAAQAAGDEQPIEGRTSGCSAFTIGGSVISGVRDVLETAIVAQASDLPGLPSATPTPSNSPTPSVVSVGAYVPSGNEHHDAMAAAA